MVIKGKQQPDYGQVRAFVYGTLKKKHYNNPLITQAGGKFLGYDVMELPSATFITFGNFPAVVYPLKGNTRDTQLVRGEIWYGPPEILHSLDILEGHPEFFHRTKQWSKIMERRCWIYTLKEDWLGEASDFMERSIWKPEETEEEFWQKYIKKNNTQLTTTMIGEERVS